MIRSCWSEVDARSSTQGIEAATELSDWLVQAGFRPVSLKTPDCFQEKAFELALVYVPDGDRKIETAELTIRPLDNTVDHFLNITFTTNKPDGLIEVSRSAEAYWDAEGGFREDIASKMDRRYIQNRTLRTEFLPLEGVKRLVARLYDA